MKLFWRLFLSMTLLSSGLLSVGGFTLIYINFSSALSSERETAYNENLLLAHSLAGTIQVEMERAELLGMEDSVRTILRRVALDFSTRPFRVYELDETLIYSSPWIGPERPLIPAQGMGSTMARAAPDQYFIQVASPIDLGDSIAYIETFRNVDYLFAQRNQQTGICLVVLGCMVVLGAGISLLLSLSFTRPITKLSRCVRNYADGDFTTRAGKYTNNELGLLARDFDSMANRLEETINELSDAAQRQERFVGSFAHELKTPLTSIIGYADLMRSKQLSPEQSSMCAGTIFQEGKRLEMLSMKLMELLVLKKQDFQLRKMPGAQLFESVARAVYPMLKSAGISFSARYERAVILAEPDLLETLCLNLIDNARKALEGRSSGKIIFKGENTEEGFRLSVIDNGRGMEPQELEKITEEFYMVDKSRSRAQGGAGLGLSICSQIAAVHGSSLKFESNPGTGTTVSLIVREAQP